MTILKQVTFSKQELARLCCLPDGVEVAAVRESDFGIVQITIADPEGKMLEGLSRLDGDKWVACPEKGETQP